MHPDFNFLKTLTEGTNEDEKTEEMEKEQE
jgi:hypothetical protein